MCSDRISSLDERISVLERVAAIAEEYVEQLDASRLARFVELYAHLIEEDGGVTAGFDEFVTDASAIERAASAAARRGDDSGELPTPLEPRGENDGAGA